MSGNKKNNSSGTKDPRDTFRSGNRSPSTSNVQKSSGKSKCSGKQKSSGSRTASGGKSGSTRTGKSAKTSKTGTGAWKSIIPSGNDSRSVIIRTCIKLFIVLLAIVIAVTAWRNRVDLSCVNIVQCAKDTPNTIGVSDGFPVSVLGSTVLAEDELTGGIALLTDTSLTVYNTSSKQMMSRAHYLNSPSMKTAGRYALLIDLGGTKYSFEAISGTLASGSTEKPLIGGAVSRNGRFAVITQGSSYNSSMLSHVQVFDHNGELLHSWHSAYYYITDAALSADGKYLAMAGVTAKDGELCSCIILHKVGKDGTLKEIELNGSLCLSLEYTNTGTLYAVCNNALAVITELGEKLELKEYEGTLQAYDISYDTGAAIYVSTSSDDSSGLLTMYDSRGTLRWSKEVELHGIAVSLGERGCCVLGRGGVIAYSLIGDRLGSWSAAVAANDILILGSRAYMVEGISLSQINLNRDESADR